MYVLYQKQPLSPEEVSYIITAEIPKNEKTWTTRSIYNRELIKKQTMNISRIAENVGDFNVQPFQASGDNEDCVVQLVMLFLLGLVTVSKLNQKYIYKIYASIMYSQPLQDAERAYTLPAQPGSN